MPFLSGAQGIGRPEWELPPQLKVKPKDWNFFFIFFIFFFACFDCIHLKVGAEVLEKKPSWIRSQTCNLTLPNVISLLVEHGNHL